MRLPRCMAERPLMTIAGKKKEVPVAKRSAIRQIGRKPVGKRARTEIQTERLVRRRQELALHGSSDSSA
jgi:hypothetical protein